MCAFKFSKVTYNWFFHLLSNKTRYLQNPKNFLICNKGKKVVSQSGPLFQRKKKKSQVGRIMSNGPTPLPLPTAGEFVMSLI